MVIFVSSQLLQNLDANVSVPHLEICLKTIIRYAVFICLYFQKVCMNVSVSIFDQTQLNILILKKSSVLM